MSFVITVDGPAGAGKGTLCRSLAQRFSFTYIDSGLMYRVLAWWATKNEVDLEQEVNSSDFLEYYAYIMTLPPDHEELRILRTESVAKIASQVAKQPQVRQSINDHLLTLSRALSPVIADGRDMGSVVFPTANIKLFITADLNARAQRRMAQTHESWDNVLRMLHERDEQDTNRALSPLKPADDAYVIDTSHLTIEESCQAAITYVENKLDEVC